MTEQMAIPFDSPQSDYIYTSSDYLVISLQPYAYDLIMSGEKTYEYRRRFRRTPAIAFIYVSTPVKAISAVIQLGTPIIGDARAIAEIAEQQRSGNGEAVYEYLADIDRGYAIPILTSRQIEPIGLKELRDRFGFIAPQSYVSMSHQEALLAELRHRAGITNISSPDI